MNVRELSGLNSLEISKEAANDATGAEEMKTIMSIGLGLKTQVGIAAALCLIVGEGGRQVKDGLIQIGSTSDEVGEVLSYPAPKPVRGHWVSEPKAPAPAGVEPSAPATTVPGGAVE